MAEGNSIKDEVKEQRKKFLTLTFTGKQILKLLQDTCRERGVTVVVITHNLALTAMGDKVIKVKNGVVDSVTVNENPLPIEQIEW